MDEMRFDARVAVITGSGRGPGRSHALLDLGLHGHVGHIGYSFEMARRGG